MAEVFFGAEMWPSKTPLNVRVKVSMVCTPNNTLQNSEMWTWLSDLGHQTSAQQGFFNAGNWHEEGYGVEGCPVCQGAQISDSVQLKHQPTSALSTANVGNPSVLEPPVLEPSTKMKGNMYCCRQGSPGSTSRLAQDLGPSASA